MLPACARSTIPVKPLVARLTLATGHKLAEARNSLWVSLVLRPHTNFQLWNLQLLSSQNKCQALATHAFKFVSVMQSLNSMQNIGHLL